MSETRASQPGIVQNSTMLTYVTLGATMYPYWVHFLGLALTLTLVWFPTGGKGGDASWFVSTIVNLSGALADAESRGAPCLRSLWLLQGETFAILAVPVRDER
jgi:hypothetical protein